MLRKARAIKNRSVIKSTIFNILIHGYCKMVICLYSLDNHNFLFVFFLKKKPSATFPFKTILARCSHTRTKIHCKQLDPLLNYVKIPRKLQKEFTNKWRSRHVTQKYPSTQHDHTLDRIIPNSGIFPQTRAPRLFCAYELTQLTNYGPSFVA